MNEVEEYIKLKGWEVRSKSRVRGEENLILDCPICGAVTNTRKNKRRFWIASKTGVWLCNECGETGNLYTLRKKLGDHDWARTTDDSDPAWLRAIDSQLDPPVQPERMKTAEPAVLSKWPARLLDTPEALDWITKERAIPVEYVERFKLGCRMQHGKPTLTIPYLVEGKPVLVKYRGIRDKFFSRERDCPSPLFNVDALEGEFRRVFIVEGELDAISMEVMGCHPVVSLPNGAKDIEDGHAAYLERFDEVLIVTDNDKPGEDAAKLIAKRLGRYRCKRVKLPQKDANDCLRKGMEDHVREAVRTAKLMSDASVVGLVEVFEQAVEDGDALEPGLSTGWTDLDLVVGGLRLHEWTVVSGDTGAGKSTFQGALLVNQVAQGRTAFEACLELPPKTVAIRRASQLLRRNVHHMTKQQQRAAISDLRAAGGDRVFMVPRQGNVPLRDLVGLLEFTIRRYGTEVFSVDHLDFVIEDPDDRKSINTGIREYNAAVNHFAVHGLLSVHPRTLDDVKGKPVRVTMNHLKGSSSIKQYAHNVLVVWSEDGGLVPIVVFKKRWEGQYAVLPAKVFLKFDPRSLSYIDAPGQSDFDAKVAAAGGY